jgi:cell division protein FtsZ
MVRPGMINLDFADVETVMSSMGKAMMGTGEAEGENRAMVATDMALNNPLIDEYSLQGARGLLVNITGGSDITLFEVDQAVNKIRAEVDPEAELIFGAIKDESMNGKIRVSIVATALDGHKPETKTVLNMFTRVQNRNSGYSEGLFSHNTRVENNTFNSIDGATALKLDESYELNNEESNAAINNFEKKIDSQPLENNFTEEELINEIPSGVSMESASYIECNNSPEETSNNISSVNEEIVEDYTPKLFSDEQSIEEDIETTNSNAYSNSNTEQLFDQDTNEDEDFEIPAFLRKQKF